MCNICFIGHLTIYSIIKFIYNYSILFDLVGLENTQFIKLCAVAMETVSKA